MAVTPINLDVLEGIDDFDSLTAMGRPIMLALERIHEDPRQPRKEFDDIKQAELAASVAEVGVRVPVSVRPHPRIDGHYILNFGARRRRAAQSAGLEAIPAWVDDLLSDFDQIIENIQRADLTPMEMALFIAEKVAEGMKPPQVAQRLGIGRTAVVKYLALIDAPAAIEAVYSSGRSTSPDTLYDLRTLYTRYPEQTRAWLTEDRDVSRRSVDELRQVLEAPQRALGANAAGGERHKARPAKVADPHDIKRPIVVVRLGDRQGFIVLARRAASDDHVLVKWDDTAETEEIAAHELTLVRLDDARRYEPINRGLGSAGTTVGEG